VACLCAGVNPCASLDCAEGERCAIDKFGIARCACAVACEPLVRPVCGDDARTYESACELRRAACAAKRRVQVKHDGACGRRRTTDSLLGLFISNYLLRRYRTTLVPMPTVVTTSAPERPRAAPYVTLWDLTLCLICRGSWVTVWLDPLAEGSRENPRPEGVNLVPPAGHWLKTQTPSRIVSFQVASYQQMGFIRLMKTWRSNSSKHFYKFNPKKNLQGGKNCRICIKK
jgi:hypothetical protein